MNYNKLYISKELGKNKIKMVSKEVRKEDLDIAEEDAEEFDENVFDGLSAMED